MSATICAHAIVGVNVSSVVEAKVETHQVTRYDEVTGVPYEKTVKGPKKLFFGSTEIKNFCDIEYNLGFDMEETANGVTIIGKTMWDSGYNFEDGRLFEVDMDQVSNTIAEVKEELAQHGIKAEPMLYFVCYLGF